MYISEVNAKKCIEKQVNYLVRSLMRRIFVLGPMQKRKKKNLKCMVNKLVILFYVVSNKVWKKMSQRELLHTALCKKKRAVIAIYDSTVQKISLAHCSKIKMNRKRHSRFRFHFSGLLGTSPMSKQETFFSMIGLREIIPFNPFWEAD